MACVKCIIAGDGPIIEEVHTSKSQLTHALRTKFEAIYAVYQADENALTQGMFAFVTFCADFLVYETTPDPIL